tara:strand:- start:1851 stop:2072 length:222 start_codon:yes stop_codon:yes gene_type:complete
MGDIGDNITIKDAMCKDIYGEDANHEDYTTEKIIAKLEGDKGRNGYDPDEIIYTGGDNEDYTTEEVIAKLNLL